MLVLSVRELCEEDRSPMRGNSTSWAMSLGVFPSDSSVIAACCLSNAAKSCIFLNKKLNHYKNLEESNVEILTIEESESHSVYNVEKEHKPNQCPNPYPIPICMCEESTRFQNLNSKCLI